MTNEDSVQAIRDAAWDWALRNLMSEESFSAIIDAALTQAYAEGRADQAEEAHSTYASEQGHRETGPVDAAGTYMGHD